MRIIGLTGGIGSGKSTVSSYLKEKGYAIVDADQIAREIVEPGSPVLSQMVQAFGADILYENGALDRKRLGSIVFSDEEKKRILDGITHGEIESRIKESIRSFTGEVLILDVPLLFEAGMERYADEVWVVDAEDEVRISRVMDRDGFTSEEVRSRMKKQMSREEKRRRGDRVLSNSGSREKLYDQIERLMGEGK